MWKLPEKIELSEISTRGLQKGILVLPQGEGFRVPELSLEADGSLVLPIQNEHSQLGKGLVEALWFERSLRLWLPECGRVLTLAPWRCHIAGPLFTRVLVRAREADAAADPTAVWELYPIRDEEATEPAPVPQKLKYDLPTQHHLDHVSLHEAPEQNL